MNDPLSYPLSKFSASDRSLAGEKCSSAKDRRDDGGLRGLRAECNLAEVSSTCRRPSGARWPHGCRPPSRPRSPSAAR